DATKVISGVFNNFKDALGDVTSDTEAFAQISATLSYVWERNQVDMNEMVQALNQAAQAAKLANMPFKDLSIVIGNLGTMMIRSGRAGRSIRMAIIQMAAKGRLLADTFGYAFDPNRPLDFMQTMDKMHEEWIKMNKTALVSAKVFTIFGRRAAPAVLALLDSWGKVREEVEKAGDTLTLVTNQQLKLLRLQERYKQITETVWKEIMYNIAAYADIVAGVRDVLHNLLRATRRGRIAKEEAFSIDDARKQYKDAGAMLERLAFLRALHTVELEKEEEKLIVGTKAWERIQFIWAGIFESGGTQRIVKQHKELGNYAEGLEKLIAKMERWYELEKAREVENKRRADLIASQKLIAQGIVTEEDALIALNREINEHRALRGEQVFTTEQLVKQMDAEKDVLDVLSKNWLTTYRVHRKNLEVIKPITDELLKQSDVVKKLASNLLKLYKIEQKATQQQQKDQLAFYDARIKLQEEYAKGVEKWTGLRENREMQAIDARLERLATERSHIKANIVENRRMAAFYAQHADATGKLPAEMVGVYQELNREYSKLSRKAKLLEKDIIQLVERSQFVGRAGVGARFTRPLDIVTEEEWERQQLPTVLAEQHRRREAEQQHELALYDIRTAYKEKYTNFFSIWYSKEEMAEKARLANQRERLGIERDQLEERRGIIAKRLVAISRARDLATPEQEKQLAGEAVSLQQEYDDIGKALKLNEEQVKSVQQTKAEAANENIRNLLKEGEALEAARQTWAFYGDTIQSYTGQMAEAWKNMFEQMGQESKTAWDIYKALAISEVIVAGIQLAWKGAQALAGIPYIGPVLAGAWIATIAAQTAVQV
ncbi:MAG: phage tail tape measure protein, partial [Candidatus Hodarchaeales archaeon]